MLKTAFVWMLNCTLCASVVLLYIMLFRLVVRRSSRRWCYLLWIPAAFRLLCSRTPFFLRWRWSLLPRADFFHTEAGSAGTLLYGAMNYTAHGDALTHVYPAVSEQVNAALLTALSLVWLLGMAAFALKGVREYRRLNRSLSGAKLIEGGLYPVYSCPSLTAPFAMGILHKRVYVPDGLNENELSMVTAHEHTHLSRHDPLWKLFAYALKCVHWMNPLVHLACRLWGADMEYTCDERVFKWISRDLKAEYCRALLSVRQGVRPMPCPVAFSEGGVKGRIKNLLSPRRHRALWGILAALIVFNVYRIGFTSSFGFTACRLRADEGIRQRLEYVLDVLADDPANANASGYFSVVYPPDGDGRGRVLTDDQALMAWLGVLGDTNSIGWYLAANTDDSAGKGAVIVRLFNSAAPVDPEGIDPRRDTGKILYLRDFTPDLLDRIWNLVHDWVYLWQYHYQTERAEVFVVLYNDGIFDSNPVYTVLGDMMDRVLSPLGI